ncbi:2-5 RNA ligase LigT [Brachyspira pilosicoli B2904]|uniref:RNA 2',3'-cyclic phosphodiesterase n=1 Tax=Brachyspira pilosicoli B2904 TaxID=1133568 RepID=J9URR3_BRAPL|nr:RNA 2',3'-cyclic phosphodiesterase [Brachyspira pilosicoli]AFR69989.1 2-5 RNA ligase LigT [Brachyspira pilosicoli B2904]
MRAFLALNIDENIKNKYHNLLLKKIDDNIAEVKFVNKNKMHITLVFFENIKESDIEKIKSSLEKTSNVIKPFNISFEKFSYFTNKFNDINVLFVKANCKELDEYVKHLRDNINIKYDKKDFKSHLTLARVKKVYDNDKLKEIINNIHFEKSSFLANSITLYESDFVNYREIFTLTF